jgi:hypothetical protein
VCTLLCLLQWSLMDAVQTFPPPSASVLETDGFGRDFRLTLAVALQAVPGIRSWSAKHILSWQILLIRNSRKATCTLHGPGELAFSWIENRQLRVICTNVDEVLSQRIWTVGRLLQSSIFLSD